MDDEAKAILREIRDLTASQMAMVEKMLDRHLEKVQAYYNETGEWSERIYKEANEEWQRTYNKQTFVHMIVFAVWIFAAVAFGVFAGVVAGHKWLPF